MNDMTHTEKSKHKTTKNKDYRLLINGLAIERSFLGLSQSDISDELGITQSELSKIENMERRIDLVELRFLIHALRVNENQKVKELITNFLGIGI
jgi:transcriptional regulator with XRE-family HTH domain